MLAELGDYELPKLLGAAAAAADSLLLPAAADFSAPSGRIVGHPETDPAAEAFTSED